MTTPERRDAIRYGFLPLVARLLLVLEFLVAVNGKITGWSGQAAYMTGHGMHFVTPLLATALAIELIGSLAIITGVEARLAAAVMALYLVIVSVQLHDFWNLSGMAAGTAMTQFFKNLGMVGGLVMVAAYGPGRWAVRWRR